MGLTNTNSIFGINQNLRTESDFWIDLYNGTNVKTNTLKKMVNYMVNDKLGKHLGRDVSRIEVWFAEEDKNFKEQFICRFSILRKRGADLFVHKRGKDVHQAISKTTKAIQNILSKERDQAFHVRQAPITTNAPIDAATL